MADIKHTICGFQQQHLLRLGLDCVDVQILNYINDFYNTSKMYHKTIDNRIYFWLSYQSVIDAMPILGITNPEMIARRLDKWCKAGLLSKHLVKGKDEYLHNGRACTRYGTYTYFSFIAEEMDTLTQRPDTVTALPESRSPGKRVRSKVAPVSTAESDTSLPQSRALDSPGIDYPSTDNPAITHTAEIIYQDGDWIYYTNGYAALTEDPKLRKTISSMLQLPTPVAKHYHRL